MPGHGCPAGRYGVRPAARRTRYRRWVARWPSIIDRVVEVVRGASQVGEVRDAPAEQHRYQADANFVYQSQVEGLPCDAGTGDGDIFCRAAISLAAAMPLATPLTKVVRGHFVVSRGALWVATEQPGRRSGDCRPSRWPGRTAGGR